jgi:spore coat protein CotH
MHIAALGLYACGGDLEGLVGGHPSEQQEEDVGAVNPGAPPDGTEELPDAPQVGDYDSFFDPFTLKEISIHVSEETIDALNENGLTYMPARFVHEGVELEVGLRLKGDSSYETFHGKPALKVKFNEFLKGQDYAGVKRIALNNLTGDTAQGREVASYWVWRSGGMKVPSAAFARVTINDEYYGLYALVEGMDDEWVERNYEVDSGDFWAGNDNADFTAAGLPNFVVQATSGAAPLSLEDVAAGLARTDGDFYTIASQVVDMDQYLDYIAFSIATGGTDGYPWHLNDFFVYGDPAEDGRLNFTPWGQDESWKEAWEVWSGHGLLGERCEADLDCNARRNDHVRAALSVYETLDVRGTMQRMFDLTDESMRTDPRSPFTPAEVDASRALLMDNAEGWPTRVRTLMEL